MCSSAGDDFGMASSSHGDLRKFGLTVGAAFVVLGAARTRLERRLGRPVTGYRSPRLDRSPDLAWALDHTGFAFDSSYPDVDRENLAHFGAGVRLNLPYRPAVADKAGGIRPSRCLELPLTAPDCIQPLFAGESVETLTLSLEGDGVRVANGGPIPITGVRVIVERDGSEHVIAVPPLAVTANTALPAA